MIPRPGSSPAHPPAPGWIVVMGVCGCGKSLVGAAVAEATGWPLIEGDAFHPLRNIEKMSAGIPLDDDDRAGWLDRLASELAARPHGAVLACSALKRRYRDRLRQDVPGLGFAFLRLTREEALRRVGARPGHFMPPALVDSQFAALEDPSGEPRVLAVDATEPVDRLAERIVRVLATGGA